MLAGEGEEEGGGCENPSSSCPYPGDGAAAAARSRPPVPKSPGDGSADDTFGNAVSARRHELALKVQATGELPEAEVQFLTEVHHRGAGDELAQMLCEVNAGIAPRRDDEQLVATYLKEEHGVGGGVVPLPAFIDAVRYWYLHTSTTAAVPDRGGSALPPRLSGVAGQLDPKDKQLVVETFARYDRNGDGCIRPSELREMMADLNSGILPTDQEVQHVMWFADTRQRGWLDLHDFESAVTFWYLHTMEVRDQEKTHCCTVL